jgi:ABC-type transporter MlaC component
MILSGNVFSSEKLKMQKILYIIPFICLCIFPTAEASEKEAVDFIGKLVNEALGIVNSANKSDDEKREELSKCVNKYLDIDRTAKAVFARLGYNNKVGGKHKVLSEEDKQKVREYLKQYLVRFYAGEGKLSAMMNAKLSGKLVAEKKGNDTDFAVTTQFEKDSSPSIKIVWVTDGKKVFYVEIEGINQIITLRSEMEAAVGSGTLMDYINGQNKGKKESAAG